jgi:hypothetical protein
LLCISPFCNNPPIVWPWTFAFASSVALNNYSLKPVCTPIRSPFRTRTTALNFWQISPPCFRVSSCPSPLLLRLRLRPHPPPLLLTTQHLRLINSTFQVLTVGLPVTLIGLFMLLRMHNFESFLLSKRKNSGIDNNHSRSWANVLFVHPFETNYFILIISIHPFINVFSHCIMVYLMHLDASTLLSLVPRFVIATCRS